MADLALTNVKKTYGKTDVIHGVDLQIEDGEFVVFVGPSGCGKSTLLRMICGLEEISDGQVNIGGTVVNHIGPADRGIAMVFQSYALYPHKDVYGNMAFALRHAGADKKLIEERVTAAAEILGLTPLLKRKPKALSGGQRQRVAIGRAIVRDPEIFLFDEPLSNLDAELRVQMRVELLKLHERLKTTMIYVTHDQIEAMTLADRIVVLRDGRIEQTGTPLELYHNPVNQFVAGFIGSPKMNFVPAHIVYSELSPQQHTLGIRPEHATLTAFETGTLRGTITVIERLGSETYIHVEISPAMTFMVRAPGDTGLERGREVGINLPPECTYFFDEQGSALPRAA